jgi:hypothetical protein
VVGWFPVLAPPGIYSVTSPTSTVAVGNGTESEALPKQNSVGGIITIAVGRLVQAFLLPSWLSDTFDRDGLPPSKFRPPKKNNKTIVSFGL